MVEARDIFPDVNCVVLQQNQSRDSFPVWFGRNVTDGDLLNYSHTTNFLRIIFVLLSRLGFLLIQVGCIPMENVYKVFFYNIFEIANSVVSYTVLGYVLSFGGKSWNNVIGYSKEFFDYDLDYLIFGISSVLLGTAQISSYIIGRLHLVGNVLVTFLYSATLQPLLMHWIWNGNGWMNKWHMMGKNVSVKDHGGSLVVHLSSTIIGVIGAIFLGRRVIKVDELDEHSVGNWSAGSTIIGYVFIIFGYIAYSLPTPHYVMEREPDNYLTVVLINNVIALSMGMLMMCLAQLIFSKTFNYWSTLRCLQGGISGLISVSSAVDIYSIWFTALVSSSGSLLFLLCSFLMQNTYVEDLCNLTSSHLVCSLLATVICPFLSTKENFRFYKNVHTLWQFLCTSAVFTVSAIFAVVVFYALSSLKVLRSEKEKRNHLRAEVLREHSRRPSFMDRLFAQSEKSDAIVPGEVRRKFSGNVEERGGIPRRE